MNCTKKQTNHTYKSKSDSLYVAPQRCQLLSWLDFALCTEEGCCSTAEDFSHVRTVVKTWEYSCKGPRLARMGIGHLGQEAWAIDNTWGPAQIRLLCPQCPLERVPNRESLRDQRLFEIVFCLSRWGHWRDENFPDFLIRNRTGNWKSKEVLLESIDPK